MKNNQEANSFVAAVKELVALIEASEARSIKRNEESEARSIERNEALGKKLEVFISTVKSEIKPLTDKEIGQRYYENKLKVGWMIFGGLFVMGIAGFLAKFYMLDKNDSRQELRITKLEAEYYKGRN